MTLRILGIGILVGVVLLFGSARKNLHAQGKDEKKDEPTQKPEKKKEEPNKAPAEKKESAYAALKAKLKAYEPELAKIRSAMLKDVETEEKRIDEVIGKLEAARKDALKTKDFKTMNEIFGLMGKLRAERTKINILRIEIDRQVNPTGRPSFPVRKLSEEERLGISASTPQQALANQLGLKKDVGVVIDRVAADSAAEKAGLKKYDVLIKLDGNAVASGYGAFRKQLTLLKSETPVEAVVIRNGKEETIKGLTMPAPK